MKLPIENNQHALREALILCITAPSDKQAEEAMELVNHFSGGLTPDEVEEAKREAVIYSKCAPPPVESRMGGIESRSKKAVYRNITQHRRPYERGTVINFDSRRWAVSQGVARQRGAGQRGAG